MRRVLPRRMGWVLVIFMSGVGIPTNASIPAPIGDRLGICRAFDSTLTGPPQIVHRLLGKARFGVLVGEASELFGRAGGGGRLEARRVARGALLWTTGTSSSPSQAGTLLRRHMAGFYSAVDTMFGEGIFGRLGIDPALEAPRTKEFRLAASRTLWRALGIIRACAGLRGKSDRRAKYHRHGAVERCSSRTRCRSSNSSLSISPLANRSLRMPRGVLPGGLYRALPCPDPPSQRNRSTTTTTATAMNTIIMIGPRIIPPNPQAPLYSIISPICGWSPYVCATADEQTTKVMNRVAKTSFIPTISILHADIRTCTGSPNSFKNRPLRKTVLFRTP